MAMDGFAFWQSLTGSREGCFFDPSNACMDISVFIHSSHSLDLAPDEQVLLSVRDLKRRDGEQLVVVGQGCHLKAVDLDATLFLRAWASKAADPAEADSRDMRVCGEVRVPMHRLVTSCHGMLYHAWLTLDSPGLHDSVASIGLAMAGDDGAEFDQRLTNGPRQVFQPKICVSICKTSDVAPCGRLVMPRDAPPEVRASHWAPLLLSQQHHAILGAALHLQRCQTGEQHLVEHHANGNSQMERLRERLRGQSDTIAEFRSKLHEQGAFFPTPRSARDKAAADFDTVEAIEQELRIQGQTLQQMRILLDKGGEVEPVSSRTSSKEVQAMRDSNAKREAQIHALRVELNRVKDGAARKTAEVNERMTLVRNEKEEAMSEGERFRVEAEKLVSECNEMRKEQDRLTEQKEALLRIVEDLHQTCNLAGLQGSDRRSIDSITMNFGIS